MTYQYMDQGAATYYILLHHQQSVYQWCQDPPANQPKEVA